MTKKIIFLVILIILFMSGVASAINITKEWYPENQTVAIFNNDNLAATLQLVSSQPDLTTMEEVFNLTAYVNYTFDDLQDFKTRWKLFKGNHNITGTDWYILQNISYTITVNDYDLVVHNQIIPNITAYSNVTSTWNVNPWNLSIGSINSISKYNFSYTYNGTSYENMTVGLDSYQVLQSNPLRVRIYWNETEIVGNHTEPGYQDEYQVFTPIGKSMAKGHSYMFKLVFRKLAEIGDISIQTVPTFMGIEEENMTWWNTSWNKKQIFNITNGCISCVINISTAYNKSDRWVNETDLTTLNHWNETTNNVWVNLTNSGTFQIAKYINNSNSYASASNGTYTFIVFDDFESYTVDTLIANYNRWTSSTGNGYIRTDYPKSGTKALRVDGTSSVADTAIYTISTPITYNVSITVDSRTNKPTNENYAWVVTPQYYAGVVNFETIAYGRPEDSVGDVLFIGTSAAVRTNLLNPYTINTYKTIHTDLHFSSYKSDAWVDNSLKATNHDFTTNVNNISSLWFRAYDAYSDNTVKMWVDNFHIRKHNLTEPTYSLCCDYFRQNIYNTGWQQIFINNTMNMTSVRDMMNSSNVLWVVAWNSTTQKFESYKAGWSIRSTDNITKGMGAMVKVTNNDTVVRLPGSGSYNWTLKSGWNLVGLDYNESRTLTQINTSINTGGGCKADKISHTTLDTQIEYTYTCGSSNNDSIIVNQGEGFFVNATQTVDIVRGWS